MPKRFPPDFFNGTFKISHIKIPRCKTLPGKKCFCCQKKASQWILRLDNGLEMWRALCHAHRIKAENLPPGARFVTRDELRMREVMES
jgi:hypothetical protein